MTSSNIASLDIPSLETARVPGAAPRRRKGGGEVVATDWNWMEEEAAKGGGDDVRTTLKDWDGRRRRLLGDTRWDKILSSMKRFTHRKLYEIGVSDVERAIRQSRPAFGGRNGVTGKDKKYKDIHRMTSAAPLNLMAHNVLEWDLEIPTSQDWFAYHTAHPQVFLDDMAKKTDTPLSAFMGDMLDHPAARAVRYRLATGYMSFIREIDMMCKIRERHGVHLAHHFLLDAIWKIDFLADDIAIEVYQNNDDHKAFDTSSDSPAMTWGQKNTVGTKKPCNVVNPARNVMVVAFDTIKSSATYNAPFLITDASIAGLASRILNRDFDHRGIPRF